jgi:hypothetical protein
MTDDQLNDERPDVMGAAEVRAFLNVSWPHLRGLRATDPSFPLPRKLAGGPVWAASAIRRYDTERRRMGVYYDDVEPGAAS